MNWGSLDDFLAMGGYAFYVWGAYGVTVLCLVAEVVILRSRTRSSLRAVARANAANPANPASHATH